jgi:hypothetical protein
VVLVRKFSLRTRGDKEENFRTTTLAAAALACGRTVLMAAVLILALGRLAAVDRAAAQSAPGNAARAQYPYYTPFPSMPYPAQAETRTPRSAERANEERREVRRHRHRRKLAERKHAVEHKQKVARRKEGGTKLAESNQNQRKLAESKGYKRLSDLVNFPKFFPGLGILYIKPDTMPTGPYLCFDRKDRLVATLYMVSIKDMDDHKMVDAAGLAAQAAGFAAPVDHVSFYFNSGHPGMDMPHYHFVIWHVSKKDEARVAQ